MPHSSYQRTFHPPIASLDRYRVKLFKLRISSQDGNREDPVEVLVLGETLFEYCEFLDMKLGMKVRIPNSRWHPRDVTADELYLLGV